jgi:hypothetical protein
VPDGGSGAEHKPGPRAGGVRSAAVGREAPQTPRALGSSCLGLRPETGSTASAIIDRVQINLVVAGAIRDREGLEPSLKHVLDVAFESDAGELNVVLTAQPNGYGIFFARAVLEHAAGRDYSEEVRAALDQAGVVVVSAGVRPL